MIHGCLEVATGDSGTASLQRILGSSRGSPLGTLLGTEGDHCGASGIATREASGTWETHGSPLETQESSLEMLGSQSGTGKT